MKKIILIHFILLTNIVFGQYNSGKITYEYQFKGVPFQKKTQNVVAQQAINKLYKDLISYSGKINYILTFNKYFSKYSVESSLNSEGDKSIQNAKNMTGAREVIYVDTSKKYKLKLLELFGDKMAVRDSLDTNWNLTQEKKKIGNYICYKAWKKNENNVLIEAWYTPQIPVNLGPKGYGNLPGLILELKQASLLFVVKEIVLNPKEKPIIKIPSNRKIISQADFNKFLKDFDDHKN